jgi:hypothetical protein
MGTLERRETLTHRLGSSGRLSVKTITGTVRIRGIEGEDAHVTATYRIRAADQASAERALDTGRIAILRGPGTLELETPERRLASGLAWLFAGARVSAEVFVEVPWGAKVLVETMSGTIEASVLVGEQRYRTVSSDVRLWNVGGLVDAGTISGGVTLDGGTALRFKANTVSGRIKARAQTFYSLILSTTSGGMTIIGALDPAGDHRCESISGSVDLTPLSGVTAELKTVSGSVNSEIEHRLDGTRGYWRATVGDGRAQLRLNTTSGSLRLMAPRPIPAAPAGTASADAGTAAGPVGATAPDAAAVAGAEAPAESAPDPRTPAEQAGPAASSAPPDTTAEEPAETWNPVETAEEAAEYQREEQVDGDELAILQALERGEIGVDEAAAQLERTRSGHVG